MRGFFLRCKCSFPVQAHTKRSYLEKYESKSFPNAFFSITQHVLTTWQSFSQLSHLRFQLLQFCIILCFFGGLLKGTYLKKYEIKSLLNMFVSSRQQVLNAWLSFSPLSLLLFQLLHCGSFYAFLEMVIFTTKKWKTCIFQKVQVEEPF